MKANNEAINIGLAYNIQYFLH